MYRIADILIILDVSNLFKNKTPKKFSFELCFNIVNFRPLSYFVNLVLVQMLLQKYIAVLVSCLNEKGLEHYFFHLSELHHFIRQWFLLMYIINTISFPNLIVMVLQFDVFSTTPLLGTRTGGNRTNTHMTAHLFSLVARFEECDFKNAQHGRRETGVLCCAVPWP
jgi:hypothetical protein